MKKIYLIAMFLLVGANLFAQSTPEWQWVHPRPQAQYLNWMKMVDANTWYAAGDYGMFMKSTNAGVNWTTKTVGYPNGSYPGAGMLQNYKCGYFLNVNTGYLGVQSVPGIVKTTNGGITFDTVRILSTGIGTVWGFSFLNASTGYLAGTANYLLMKTTNSGLTWTQLPNLSSGTYRCVYAADENHILTGSQSGGNVYITTDGGNSWNVSNVGTTNEIYNMKFSNALTGYVCGSAGLVRYTTNGGVTWTGSNVPTNSSLFSIVVEGSTVYVSGYVSTEQVYKSTDNGNTWSSISYAGAASITGFLAFSFDKNGNNMMCVGTFGEMLKSTNNGSNWVTLSYRRSLANLSGDLYAQSNNGRIIACGVNLGSPDAILSSPDGGVTWTVPNFGINSYCSSISMINPSTGYLCGRWGLFFKTTNGGETWDTSRSNNPIFANYFCSGIDFLNENTGWMVGGDPNIGGNTKIWKTTNGGVNWTEQPSSYAGPVGFRIDMVNANTGYMTYRAGLQKTTNGGVNWTILPTPAPGYANLPVKAIDSVNVYTTGSNCQVYASNNGGTSWDSLNFPVYAGGFFSADWYDKNNGCAGATIGVVGRTTNRGQSWQVTNCGGYAIYGIKMVHPDTIFVINGNQFGAMIMKYSKGIVTGGFTYEHKVPENFNLKQNYPNPFNPTTTIEFDLPKAGIVTLRIFDIAGREVSKEINSLSLRTGNYKVNFNSAGLSSGVYFYSLVVDGANIATKKMVLVK